MPDDERPDEPDDTIDGGPGDVGDGSPLDDEPIAGEVDDGSPPEDGQPSGDAPEGDDAAPDLPEVDDRFAGALDVRSLEDKVDTIAGAIAAVASSHSELLAHVAEAEVRRQQDAEELRQRMALLEERVQDRLAAVRDAAAAPLADLQALLQARVDRDDHDLTEVTETVRRLAAEGPAPIREQLAELREAVDELAAPAAPAGAPAELLERLDDLAQAVQAVTWQVPELTEELATIRERVERLDLAAPVDRAAREVRTRVTSHTDAALAGVLRLIDDRLLDLRRSLTSETSPATMGGFEAGALVGATQNALTRLDQRIDHEFDELGRQLQALATLVEQVSHNAEAAANRPIVTGDQVRRAATSVRESVLTAARNRRERRAGQRGLGRG